MEMPRHGNGRISPELFSLLDIKGYERPQHGDLQT